MKMNNASKFILEIVYFLALIICWIVILKGITTFMNKLFEYPGGFWVKFFIFLGIIYLIQVIFSLVFDVIELVLLVFVAIKRLVVWIYRKITGKNKHEETEQKIAGL
jgi:hypothetical protein